MIFFKSKTTLILALGFTFGCKTDKAPEAPPASAEATKDESAASSGNASQNSGNENLYEEDPFGANLASEDGTDTDTSTSTGSTTDVLGALKDVQAQAPQGPDEKAMLGKAVLSSFMGVMPSLLQAGMSGQKVDLGRVGLGVAYNTGQNMMAQYQQNAQQQAQQQQQLQLQQQGQSFGTGQ